MSPAHIILHLIADRHPMGEQFLPSNYTILHLID